ncbi:MAG TPA: peptidogalycan biosysnthesis protein, partial [Rhizobium sp.]|nr:peptidogalycan biosysnthesis protein [Rhizobium sp.]
MTQQVSIRIEQSFTAIPPELWATLEGTGRDKAGGSYNPFNAHGYLSALEESGSATAETGWLGHHLLLEDAAGTLLGAVPCYLKSHSRGEYVFDH